MIPNGADDPCLLATQQRIALKATEKTAKLTHKQGKYKQYLEKKITRLCPKEKNTGSKENKSYHTKKTRKKIS